MNTENARVLTSASGFDGLSLLVTASLIGTVKGPTGRLRLT